MDDYKLKLDGIDEGILVEIRKLICRNFLGNTFSQRASVFLFYALQMFFNY